MLSCACDGQMGEAPSVAAIDAPNTEAALSRYIKMKLAKNEPFWISEDLNSGHFTQGMGGILSKLVSVAGIVAAPVTGGASLAVSAATIAATAKSILKKKKKAPTAAEMNAELAAQGVTIPADGQSTILPAAITDAFGPQYRSVVTLGILGLGMFLIAKMANR